MVHPETGEIGWSGLPDEYVQNVINTLKQQGRL